MHPPYRGQIEKFEDFLEFKQLFLLLKPGIPSKGMEGKLTNFFLEFHPSFSALKPGIIGTGKHEKNGIPKVSIRGCMFFSGITYCTQNNAQTLILRVSCKKTRHLKKTGRVR